MSTNDEGGAERPSGTAIAMNAQEHNQSSVFGRAAVATQAKASALSAFTALFAQALDAFDDSLFDRSDRAGNSQLPFLDAMRELRLRRPAMAAAFSGYLDRAWEAFASGNPVPAEQLAQPVDPAAGLALVDEDELEIRLAARNLAFVLTRVSRAVLGRLDRRMGCLIGKPDALEAAANPIGPDHLAMAYLAAFGVTAIETQVQLVLFKLCERELQAGIAGLYEKLDAELALLGVLPDMASPTRSRVTTSPSVPDEPLPEAHAAGNPQWVRRLGRQSTAEAMGETLGMDEEIQASEMLHALHTLLAAGRQHGRSNAGAPSRDVQGNRELSQQEMLNVLSLLQSSAPVLTADHAADDLSLSHRLKHEVLASAGRLGVDPATARLGEADEDAIDLVGMLFDVILDERDLPGRSREVISRLVVPFVKVALLDRRMFVQKTHPARRLLNALAEACEGNTGQTPAERMLIAKVEEITERLLAEFNENLAIFMTLEEEFRDFLAQHRRKVEVAERRAAETQRGQEKLEIARRRASEELSARLRPDFPPPITAFLSKAWCHHLTLQLLRETSESAAGAVEALSFADGLVHAFSLACQGQFQGAWLQEHMAMIARIYASVGVYGDTLEKSVAVLHATLQAVADQQPERSPELPELPALALPNMPASETDSGPERWVQGKERREFCLDDAQRFREMEIGTWLDFVDKDGKVQAGKLSWISPISARLLFVSRRGVRFCVASPEELAVMVRLGRLRAHENDGMFDTAMMGVIDRLDGAASSSGPVLH